MSTSAPATRWADVRTVLFDLDGTLIDSAPDLGAAADRMRLDRGLPSLSMAAYRSMAGAGARGMIGVAFGLKPEDAGYAALRDEFFGYYAACMAERTAPFDGVADMLATLRRQGRAWGVVTNKAARFTDPLTRGMPVFDTAAAIVSGDTTPHAKPHPAPLLEAMRRIGVEARHCIYVGDDERDIVAGRAAGMRTVAAAYGYLGPHADVTPWKADAIIHSPTVLLQLLEAA